MKLTSILRSGFILGLFSVLAASIFAQATGSSATALVGQTVTISVTADGTTPFTYQWFLNGTAVSGATANPLVITNAQVTAAGTYTVSVTNSAGSATSNNAVLTMLAPPVITTQPVSLVRAVGTAASFTVVATGNPAPTYQWTKNGVTISGATNATYSIASVATTDAGIYACVVTSTVGTGATAVSSSVTSANATLTVNVVAPVITNISMTVK